MSKLVEFYLVDLLDAPPAFWEMARVTAGAWQNGDMRTIVDDRGNVIGATSQNRNRCDVVNGSGLELLRWCGWKDNRNRSKGMRNYPKAVRK